MLGEKREKLKKLKIEREQFEKIKNSSFARRSELDFLMFILHDLLYPNRACMERLCR